MEPPLGAGSCWIPVKLPGIQIWVLCVPRTRGSLACKRLLADPRGERSDRGRYRSVTGSAAVIRLHKSTR